MFYNVSLREIGGFVVKYFTLKEANSILPQIKLLVDEIKEKREKLYEIIDKY